MKIIGQPVPQQDWRERTSGATLFTSDLAPPGLLVGHVLRAPHPHADILSIDIAAARQMPGVHAVITAADFPPGIRYRHEGAADRPPLADGVVRFIGQEVAAVAAESDAAALAALRAIRIRYRRRLAPGSIGAALAPRAAALHNRAAGQKLGRANIAAHLQRAWGDVAAGRAASRHVAEGDFWFPQQAHACLEAGATLAEWSEETQRLHLHSATSAPYYVVHEVAHVLGLREDQVVCHEIGVGGSFGAKSKISDHEAIAGALAIAARRPVRIALTRAEEFATSKTRHGFATWLRVHADAAGRLCLFEARILVENGAYSHSGGSVMGAGVKALGMLYQPDALLADARLVDTAKQPGGQFRGYGTTQTSFALESLIDELAQAQGWDPVALRIANANPPGSETLVGARLGSARLAECLRAAAADIGWDTARSQRRPGCGPNCGVGIAAGVHTSGSFAAPGANRSDCAIDLGIDGRAVLRFGGADTGTGQKTILAQIAAEELGISLDQISVVSMDSDRTPFDMGAWSSRGTHYTGHAARQTAQAAAARLRQLAARVLGNAPITLIDGEARDDARGVPIGDLVALAEDARHGVLTTETSYVEAEVALPDPATGRGNISASYNFAAHAARVQVDTRTGLVRVQDYVAVHDLGRAINPMLAEGQIVGGVAMGLGAALCEDMLYEQCRPITQSFLHYALPRAADLPRIRARLVPGTDPHGPYGAKAVGELGVNPVAPAIANAVFDAIGVRIHSLPITPDKIITALAKQQGRRRHHAVWRRPGRWWIAAIRWLYPKFLLPLLHRFARLPDAMPSPPADPAQPADLPALLAALAGGAAALGGGTDLLVRRAQGLAPGGALASTTGIADIATIIQSPDGALRIGAAATLAMLAALPANGVASALLAAASGQIAGPALRNLATFAGNLAQAKRCWFYRNDFPCFKRVGGLAPCYAIAGDHRFQHAVIDGHRCQAVTPSDLATVLVALDAVVELRSARAVRRVKMAEFYTGPGETCLAADEAMIAVRIPPQAPRRRASYQKLRLWEGDFAIASVVVSTEIDADGIGTAWRIVLGGMAPTPFRARRTEAALAGHALEAGRLRAALNAELDARAHPLPRNGWKLDAAIGLAETALEAMLAEAG